MRDGAGKRPQTLVEITVRSKSFATHLCVFEPYVGIEHLKHLQ